VLRFGVPSRYIPQSTVEAQWESCGLTAPKILEKALASLEGTAR